MTFFFFRTWAVSAWSLSLAAEELVATFQWKHFGWSGEGGIGGLHPIRFHRSCKSAHTQHNTIQHTHSCIMHKCTHAHATQHTYTHFTTLTQHNRINTRTHTHATQHTYTTTHIHSPHHSCTTQHYTMQHNSTYKTPHTHTLNKSVILLKISAYGWFPKWVWASTESISANCASFCLKRLAKWRKNSFTYWQTQICV